MSPRKPAAVDWPALLVVVALVAAYGLLGRLLPT